MKKHAFAVFVRRSGRQNFEGLAGGAVLKGRLFAIFVQPCGQLFEIHKRVFESGQLVYCLLELWSSHFSNSTKKSEQTINNVRIVRQSVSAAHSHVVFLKPSCFNRTPIHFTGKHSCFAGKLICFTGKPLCFTGKLPCFSLDSSPLAYRKTSLPPPENLPMAHRKTSLSASPTPTTIT